MYNTSKISSDRALLRHDSSNFYFSKNDDMSKTTNLLLQSTNLKYPSLEYKKRPNNFSKTKSLPKLNFNFEDSRSPYPEFKLEGSHIANAKMLNDEFRKKLHNKKSRKVEEAQQTSFDNRLNVMRNNLSQNNMKMNSNCHEQVLNFDNKSITDDTLKEHLIVFRRYSLHTFYMLQNIMNKKNTGFNNSTLGENRNVSKSMDQFFNLEKLNHYKTQPKFTLRNQNDIKDQFHEAVESSSKAVLDAVKMRRKNNSISSVKTNTFKEKQVNQFFNDVLEKVFRKVNYISEKNSPKCQDYVVNLIHQEVINITKNIEGLIQSPAFIKNFTQKKEIEGLNSNLLPFLGQPTNSKSNTHTNFNPSKFLLNSNGLDFPHNNKISINFKHNSNNLLSIKEEDNINEDNNELSETFSKKLSSKSKRNWSFGELFLKKDIHKKVNLNFEDLDKIDIDMDLKRLLSDQLLSIKKKKGNNDKSSEKNISYSNIIRLNEIRSNIEVPNNLKSNDNEFILESNKIKKDYLSYNKEDSKIKSKGLDNESNKKVIFSKKNENNGDSTKMSGKKDNLASGSNKAVNLSKVKLKTDEEKEKINKELNGNPNVINLVNVSDNIKERDTNTNNHVNTNNDVTENNNTNLNNSINKGNSYEKDNNLKETDELSKTQNQNIGDKNNNKLDSYTSTKNTNINTNKVSLNSSSHVKNDEKASKVSDKNNADGNKNFSKSSSKSKSKERNQIENSIGKKSIDLKKVIKSNIKITKKNIKEEKKDNDIKNEENTNNLDANGVKIDLIENDQNKNETHKKEENNIKDVNKDGNKPKVTFSTNEETIKSKDKNFLKNTIREVEEDEEDKQYVQVYEDYDKVTLTDRNLVTDSSRSKDEKEEGKEENTSTTKAAKFHHSKSVFGTLNNQLTSNGSRRGSEISSSINSFNKNTENLFIHRLVNDETVVKKKEKKSKIYRANKKTDKMITNENKASEEEAEEIQKKMNKMNNFDSISQIDEKMSEEFKRTYYYKSGKNELYIFNINQDIEYQLSKGTLSLEEKKRYEDLKHNINTMKIDMSSFVKDLENTFIGFKGEIDNIEEVRKNEERINSFYFYLNDARNKTNIIRNNITTHRLKVVDNRPSNKLQPLLIELGNQMDQKH